MSVNEYFESIKKNKAKLRQFIADMPKGGDLHNHLIGAAYAETLFKIGCQANLYADLDTGKLYDTPQTGITTVRLDKNMENFHENRMILIDKWSIRDFQPYKYPLGPDEYFFSLFSKFLAAANGIHLADIVHELKVRAKEENLQYIETIGISPTVSAPAFLSNIQYDHNNRSFKRECYYHNLSEFDESTYEYCINDIIDKYEKQYTDPNSDLRKAVEKYVADNKAIVQNAPDDDTFKIKLQGYASRGAEPLIVLCQLYIIYKAMECIPDILVGCNIVAAENSENSMLCYKLHMLMFKKLNERFKRNIALHAGELTLGLVPPEHLTYHITDAVRMANAKRIGHGVDIAFEHNSSELLKEMKEKNIAIEINLTSNEFILGVKDDSHPFMIYKDSGVPMVIATDDPGILRTSITEEYTLAAYRYDLAYDDIKKLVSNSIEYSFLSDSEKAYIRNIYNAKLAEFEAKYNNM